MKILKTLLCLLVLPFLCHAAEIDRDVRHLPHGLRAASIEFFDSFEDVLRKSDPGVPVALPSFPKTSRNNLQEYYPTSTIRDHPTTQYIQWVLFEDGIGRTKLSLPKPDRFDFEVEAKHQVDLEIPVELRGMLATLVAADVPNPFACFFQGVFGYHEGGASPDVFESFEAAGNSFYSRSIAFARRIKAAFPPTINTHDLEELGLRIAHPSEAIRIIATTRTHASEEVFTKDLECFEADLKLLPGNTQIYWDTYQDLHVGIKAILRTINQPPSWKDIASGAFCAGLIFGTAWFIDTPDYEPAFVTVASGIELAAVGFYMKSKGILLRGLGNVEWLKNNRRRWLPANWSDAEIDREARLASLYLVSHLHESLDDTYTLRTMTVPRILDSVCKVLSMANLHSNDSILRSLEDNLDEI